MLKIGLLAGSTLSEFRLNTLRPILEDRSFCIKTAIIDARPEKSLMQKLRKNIKLGRGGYVLVMVWQRLLSKRESGVDTKVFCAQNGIDVIEAKEPYSDRTIDLVRRHDLDVLLLMGGFGIIKEPLLNATRLGVLSYHHGDMRKYRGMPPALWELYNNEREMGVTVQILAPGLDCGTPVEEKAIQVQPKDNLTSLRKRAFRESENMMYCALQKLSRPGFKRSTIEKLGNVYTLPTLRQWITLNLKILWRKIH